MADADYPELADKYPELSATKTPPPAGLPGGMVQSPAAMVFRKAQANDNQPVGFNTLRALFDKLVEPGVYDSIMGAHKKLTEIQQKYSGEGAGAQAIDVQNEANQNMQAIPDLGPGNPGQAALYSGAKDSIGPDIQATYQGVKNFELNETHGILGKLTMPLTIPEQFATREAINGLVAIKKMDPDSAKQMLSQNQVFPSDLVNYYWKDPSNLAMRGTRWLLGMGMNIALDPAQAIQGLAKLTASQKQIQYAGKIGDFSKASEGELLQAKVASNVSAVISQDKQFMTDTNMSAVQSFGDGKIGFDDMMKKVDLPDHVKAQVALEKSGIVDQPSLLDSVASGEKGPVIGLKVPFTNVSYEYAPAGFRALSKISGKAAQEMLGVVGKADAWVGDKIQDFMGKMYGVAQGIPDSDPTTSPVRLAVAAINQVRSRTDYPMFNQTLNEINGLKSQSNDLVQKIGQRASSFMGARPEDVANVSNVLELENKNVPEVLQRIGAEPGGNEAAMLNASNDKAAQIREGFPEQVTDQLNDYIDYHRNLSDKLLSMKAAAGIRADALDPIRGGAQGARNYLQHVVTQDFLNKNQSFKDSIFGGQEVLLQRYGGMVDRSQMGRQYTGLISDANDATQKALGMPMFSNNPVELLQHQAANTFRQVQQARLARSALDHSIVYSPIDEANVMRLQGQYSKLSELAEAGDHDAMEQIQDIGPQLNEAQAKVGHDVVGSNWVTLNPDHFKEHVFVMDSAGQLEKDENGFLKTTRKAMTNLPDEFFNGSTVKMPEQIYSRLLENINPFKDMNKAELLLDRAGNINSNFKSIFTTNPGFWGMMAVAKTLRYLQAGQVNPVRGLLGAVRQMEPMAPIEKLWNYFKGPETAVGEAIEQDQIHNFPDGALTRQQLHDEMIQHNVIENGFEKPQAWGNVLDQVSGIRAQNSAMGAGAKTALELATLWRTGRYVVGGIDDFYKTAHYIGRRLEGFTAAGAAEDTERQFFNFNNVSNQGVNKVLNVATMFTRHPVKELEYELHTLAQGPLAQLSIPTKVQATLEGQYVQDPDVREAIEKQLPSYQKYKDQVLGPMMAGQRQLMYDIPWSNNTLNFFLDPATRLSPIAAVLGAALSPKVKSYDEDSDPSHFLDGVKQAAQEYLPFHLREMMMVAETNGYLGDTEGVFGKGGIFGNLPQSPVGQGKGGRHSFNDQLDFGAQVQGIYGENPIFKMLFNPIDPETDLRIDQQKLSAEGSIAQKSLGAMTGSMAHVVNMGANSYKFQKEMEDKAAALKLEIKHVRAHDDDLSEKAMSEKAMSDRWSGILNGTQELDPMDRTFLIHMGALNKNYSDLNEQMKKEISDRGLLPDAKSLEDYDTLNELSKINPKAAQMKSIMEEKSAVQHFYKWWVNVNQEAQEKTGVQGFDPIRHLFGLDKIDLSSEQKGDLNDLKELSPALNRGQNMNQILDQRNKETLQ